MTDANRSSADAWYRRPQHPPPLVKAGDRPPAHPWALFGVAAGVAALLAVLAVRSTSADP